MEAAGYSQEHPAYNHVNLRVQTSAESGVTGEQGMVQSLELLKDVSQAMSGAMEAAMARHGAAA